MPVSTPPIGTPDCLIEKIRFMLRAIGERDRRCDAAGLVPPEPSPITNGHLVADERRADREIGCSLRRERCKRRSPQGDEPVL
jgi:hypothetical protein